MTPWSAQALELRLMACATPATTASTAPTVPQSAVEGPVWNLFYTRVFPGKMEQYVEQMRLFLIPILEEDKRQGGLLDYKILRKSNQQGPEDLNVALAIVFKNYAKMDG